MVTKIKNARQCTNIKIMVKINEKLRAVVNDPAFSRPISALKKEYTGGTLILVTRIKIYK